MTHAARLAPWFVATLLAAGCVEDRCRSGACTPDGDASADAASSDTSTISTPDASAGEDAVAADSASPDASAPPDGSTLTDATVGDASSSFVLLPTDQVVAYASQLVASRLSVACVRLGVVRGAQTLVVPDDAVTSITTSTTDAAIAQPASREDCLGVGAITLAAGATSVEADVVVQSRMFHVRYALRVLAERIAVDADSLLTATMHVDELRAFTVSNIAVAGATTGSMKSSWLRVTSSGPAITVERILGHRWRATGRMLGDATLSAVYGPPGMEQTYTAPAPISVVAPGAVVRVEEVLFRGATDDDFTARFQLQPAQCADLAVRAWYRSPLGVMYPAVSTMATFTAEGATRIETAATTRVCADTRGQTTIRGCIGSACRERDEFVSSPGARLELAPTAITATRVDAMSSRACVPLRGAVVFTDGARINLTLAQLTRSIALSEAMAPYRSVIHTVEAGMPEEFCFRAQTAATQYVLQAQAYQFAARIPVTVP